MGLFDTIWPKSSYVSMANTEKEARRSRQTASPLLAEHDYNKQSENVSGQPSQSQKLIRRQYNVDLQDNVQEYEVKLDDNLTSIAARFWTTPAIIKQMNKLTTNHLFVGQVIVVPKLEAKKREVWMCGLNVIIIFITLTRLVCRDVQGGSDQNPPIIENLEHPPPVGLAGDPPSVCGKFLSFFGSEFSVVFRKISESFYGFFRFNLD